MVAGFNLKVGIYRRTYATDDRVGGANFTVSAIKADAKARLSSRRSSTLMLEQGLMADRIYDLSVRADEIIILENDEIEITWPTDHPHYGDRFLVKGVQYPGRRRKHGGPQHCTLSRMVKAKRRAD